MKNVMLIVDSTPEEICICGYHANACACPAQKQTAIPQKPTTGLMLMSGGIAKLQTALVLFLLLFFINAQAQSDSLFRRISHSLDPISQKVVIETSEPNDTFLDFETISDWYVVSKDTFQVYAVWVIDTTTGITTSGILQCEITRRTFITTLTSKITGTKFWTPDYLKDIRQEAPDENTIFRIRTPSIIIAPDLILYYKRKKR